MNDLPGRIGLNAVFLRPNMGGVETYVKALVPELASQAPQVRFSVYCGPEGVEVLRTEAWSAEVELVTHPLLGRPGLKALSELTVLGYLAGREVDILHSVAMTAPLRTRAVNVVTVPDVTWITQPDPGEAATARLWRVIVPPVARRADRVITHSESSASEIVQRLRLAPERIDVIPHGQRVGGNPPPVDEVILRERYSLGSGPIVLSVSAKKVHKNLLRLVRAMSEVVKREPDAVLVLPGNPTAHERELRAEAEQLGLSANVAFPPYVDAGELEGLYAAARCSIIPSTSEGFGLPVLEAMRRGVPVACSNVSSLPEVGGSAVRYFDPTDVQDIAQAIVDLLSDRELSQRLARAGRERVAGFTWEAAAKATLESYSRAWAAKERRARRAAIASR